MDIPTDPPAIVMGPVGDPAYRRMESRHEPVGKAYRIENVVEFARRAGLEDLDPYDPGMAGRRHGAPDVWA